MFQPGTLHFICSATPSGGRIAQYRAPVTLQTQVFAILLGSVSPFIYLPTLGDGLLNPGSRAQVLSLLGGSSRFELLG